MSLIAAAIAGQAIAAPGDLREGFGFQGRALVDVGAPGAAYAVAQLPDGRIVLGGVRSDEFDGNACAVAVVKRDGSLDASFGDNGVVVVDYDASSDLTELCLDLKVQPDGKIVLVGYRLSSGLLGNVDMMVVRLLADGSPDPGFSGNGYAFINFALVAGSIDVAEAVAIQDDGKLVVVGRAERGPDDYDVAVARLNSDGTPDTSFSGDGRTTLGVDVSETTIDEGVAVVIQPNGRIVVAGISEGSQGHMLVARFTASGAPDSSFNLLGYRVIPFGLGQSTYSTARAVAIRDDATLLLGGYVAADDSADFAAAAVLPNGELDATFGVDGRMTADFAAGGNDVDGALDAALDAEGRLVLAGVINYADNIDMAVLRISPEGLPDPEFGDNGRVVVAFDLAPSPYLNDEGRALHVMPGGDILVAGGVHVSAAPPYSDFAIVRLDAGDQVFESGFE